MKNLKIFGKINFCLMVIVITMLTISKPADAQSKAIQFPVSGNSNVNIKGTVTISSGGSLNLSANLFSAYNSSITIRITFYDNAGKAVCQVALPYWVNFGGATINDNYHFNTILTNYSNINGSHVLVEIQ
jgi:hypothetical protein